MIALLKYHQDLINIHNITVGGFAIQIPFIIHENHLRYFILRQYEYLLK